MPENWKTYKLGDLGTIVTGKTPSSKFPEDYGNDISFVTPTDFSNFHKYVNTTSRFLSSLGVEKLSKKVLPANSVLVTCIGSQMGKVTINKEKVVTNQQLNSIVTNEKVNSDYLYYKLISIHNELRTIASGGSTMPLLNKTDFENIEITIPEIKEQSAIASILSALDDKIENNLAMNKTLEDMAMALYKHWFVDFGPFQEGKFIDSELGEIPEGWEVKELGELLNVKHGFAFKGKFFTTEKRKDLLLTPGNFQRNGGIKFNWGKQKFYEGEVPSDYVLKKGDLVLALTDLTQSCEILGAPAFIPDEDFNYLHNQRLGLIEQTNEFFTKDALFCMANSSSFRGYIRSTKTGSTVSHTSPSRIYKYKIAIPGVLELNHVYGTLKNYNETRFSNLSENKSLTKLRDTLLPKLISGEVCVKDVEQLVSEVL